MTAYRVLIVGGDSSIGKAVATQLKQAGCVVYITSRRKNTASRNSRYLDLSKLLDRWQPPQVDACLLAGAVSSLQFCREHPEYCERTNVKGTLEIAARLHAQGAYILFLSSNQVFDGSVPRVPQDALVNPLSLYGSHKAQVEAQLLCRDNACGIMRLSKVLDSSNALLNSWHDNLIVRRRIQAFEDYFMAPVAMSYVSEVIAWMLQTRLPGVIQLSGDQDISYYEIATMLASELDATQLVKPVSARRSGALEHIPAHTTLDCSRLLKHYDTNIPSSRDTVFQIIHDMCLSTRRLSVYD